MPRHLSRRARFGVLALLLATTGVCRFAETRRMNMALPRARDGTEAEPRLDTAAMLSDLETLASDPFEGRATGTPGGRKAAGFIESRFAQLGLGSFGNGFIEAFSFTHHSIRAIWRRDRPFARTFDGARNLVGFVAGTALPDEFLVVSAHYDHLGVRDGQIFHGADDNASGTAALLAIAGYFARHPPRHSILMAAFDAEELGLRGSRAFVEAPPVPLERLRIDVNMDMLSRSDDGARLFVAGTHQTPALADVVARAARSSSLSIHFGHDRPIYATGLIADWTGDSDQGSFDARGIPFLYFGVEDHEDLHRPTDTADRIDRAFYARAVEAVLDTLLLLDAGDLRLHP
jgi:Peptidase family M28